MTGPIVPPPDGQTIYRLLGLSPSVSTERLRHAYEWAVADASRRGDHQTLLMLSRAFDQLEDKHTIYPSAAGRLGVPMPAAPPDEGVARMRHGPRRSARSSRRRTTAKHVLAYGVVVPAIVVAVVLAVINSNNDAAPGPPIRDQHAVIDQQIPPSSTPSPFSVSNLPRTPERSPLILQPHAIIAVPANAPTAADGLARILCQPDGSDKGYVEAASRGSRVSCPNGATPRILG